MNKGSAKLSRFFSFIFVLSFNQSHFFFLFGQLSLVIEQSPSLSFVHSHRWVEKLRKETNETMKVNSQLVIRLCEPYNEIRVMVWRNRGEIREMNRFLVLARFLIYLILLSFRGNCVKKAQFDTIGGIFIESFRISFAILILFVLSTNRTDFTWILEYGYFIWSPYCFSHIDDIKKVRQINSLG